MSPPACSSSSWHYVGDNTRLQGSTAKIVGEALVDVITLLAHRNKSHVVNIVYRINRAIELLHSLPAFRDSRVIPKPVTNTDAIKLGVCQ